MSLYFWYRFEWIARWTRIECDAGTGVGIAAGIEIGGSDRVSTEGELSLDGVGFGWG